MLRKFLMIVKVIEVRLRFVVVLVLVGLLIGKWDTIVNYWDRYTRPASVASRRLPDDQEFFCPMHPLVVRDHYEPDGGVPKCPICGMPLSLRTKGKAEELPAGVTARVQLSPDRIELAGIETAEVQFRPFSKRISTVGTVAYDEGRLSRVVSRTSGYVEKLYIDRTFVKVNRGDPLAEIYSPDLYSTAQEMLLAAKGDPSKDLAASARRRLKLFGVSRARDRRHAGLRRRHAAAGDPLVAERICHEQEHRRRRPRRGRHDPARDRRSFQGLDRGRPL